MGDALLYIPDSDFVSYSSYDNLASNISQI